MTNAQQNASLAHDHFLDSTLLCEAPSVTGRLFLWFPLSISFGKVARHLKGGVREHVALEDQSCIIITLDPQTAGQAATELVGLMTTEEARNTRCLFMLGNSQPEFADFNRVNSLQQFESMTRATWLVDLIAENRLTHYFQPIVFANDTGRVYAQEALLRGIQRDGSIIMPNKLIGTAREADVLHQLDRASRIEAIREAARQGVRSQIFINFTPSAIYDPANCLISTACEVKEAGFSPEQIVFEVIESEAHSDVTHMAEILDIYRRRGFGIALDDMGAGYSSLNLIHQLKPDFVKIDMELVRNVHADGHKALILRKVLEIAGELSIETVAEGVETKEELDWVRAHGANYVQGFLVARPSPTATVPGAQA